MSLHIQTNTGLLKIGDNITKDKIISALEYVPANEEDVENLSGLVGAKSVQTQISEAIANENLSQYATDLDLDTHIANTTAHITSAERTAWNNKSDSNHNHDDIYDTLGSAANALTNAKTYTDAALVDTMAKTNPTGTGTLSLNRKSESIIGDYSVAEGYDATASGNSSHAEGYNTTASNYAAHAEGSNTTASGNSSHAEGVQTTASGDYSHAEGSNITASGNSSHAEGAHTTANGTAAHAEGFFATASGDYSHAGGYNTIANDYQYVVGKFNKDTTAPTSLSDTEISAGLLIVGIGTSSSDRSNGFRVNPAGKVYGTGTFANNGADYAEYFEWFDGNPNNEDRRGHFVTLDGDKIRYATPNDDYILGVVSADPSVAGDVYSEDWHNRYLKDIFGSKIVDVVEVEETTNENGEIIPAHTERRWVLNPDYDHNAKYISREERPEWAAIGIIGKLVVVDDGTCQVNGYCQPSVDGIATASQEKTNYRVMERLDDTHIRIFIK